MEIWYDEGLTKVLFSFCPSSEFQSVLVFPSQFAPAHQVNTLSYWKAALLLGWLDFQAKRLGAGDFQVVLKV